MRLCVMVLAFAAACSRLPPDLPAIDSVAYRDTIESFHRQRATAIAGPEGWSTLIGLWWLEPGRTRIGSDATADIVLPRDRAPNFLGTFVASDSTTFAPAKGVRVLADGRPVIIPVAMRSDVEAGDKQTMLRYGSLVISYITRSGRKGIRVKDTLSAARSAFAGHRYFPTDTAWRVTARYVAKPRPDSMNIVDVLGIQTRMAWPGELRFRIHGKPYVLQVIREPEDHGQRLFVMFRDSTNLKETYPAMRYTYVALPDSLGRTALDFNQSYNPPCAFTSAATCPLPPKGNALPLRITAGELRPAGH
jgi:uncharacterized protein (DUF1684 family)